MLSKKHYNKIAEIIRKAREGGLFTDEFYADEFVYALCDFLKDNNPRFDTEQFAKATRLD